MPKLKFYDLKNKKAFETDKYKFETNSGRFFAIAISPSGAKSYRIVSKEFYSKNK